MRNLALICVMWRDTKMYKYLCLIMLLLSGAALLSASLYVHSEDIDSADADYCIDWQSEKFTFSKGFVGGVKLVLVKKHNDLKNTLEPIECFYSYSNLSVFHHIAESASFDFIDESGQKIFSFESFKSAGGTHGGYDGPCMVRIHCSDSVYYALHKWSPPKTQLDYPTTTSFTSTTLEKFSKDDLLWFKNKIINAQIEYEEKCDPNIKRTYRIDFRARITGECGCDSIKEKRK